MNMKVEKSFLKFASNYLVYTPPNINEKLRKIIKKFNNI